jgi:hypothetical protein
MEGGLSDKALKVLRAVLQMNLSEMPDPAVVADRISLFELACERACGPATLAEIRNWCEATATNSGASRRLPQMVAWMQHRMSLSGDPLPLIKQAF